MLLLMNKESQNEQKLTQKIQSKRFAYRTVYFLLVIATTTQAQKFIVILQGQSRFINKT